MAEIILDGDKLRWHKERVEAMLAGERVAPLTIDCALTRNCSYRCVYCYGQLQHNIGDDLSLDVIYRFLDDAAEIGVKAVSFVSDGESTCSPHLYDAILRGKSNGLDMALGTNGYLLRDDRLQEILPALSYLRFNISAGEPERYAEIHGCAIKCFHKVCSTIAESVRLKREHQLEVTLGMQMVLMPELADQIMPLSELGRDLGVDYLVIKHCSDDEDGSLGVDYGGYASLTPLLERAEGLSTEAYRVAVKWSKIKTGNKRCYTQCYGPPLILQMSGSGLVAPCGMFFNEKYSKYHIGNISQTPLKELWQGERYWEVMNSLTSSEFNANTDCGTLCLQHKVNERLWRLTRGEETLPSCDGEAAPLHVNFI